MWQKWNYTFLHELVSLSSATIWRRVININISADSLRLSWLFAHEMEFLWFSWIFLSHCQFCRFRCDLIICVFFRLTTFHTIIHAKPPPPHQRRGWLPLVIVRLSVSDVYQSWQQSEELMLLVELREQRASLHNQLMFHSIFYLYWLYECRVLPSQCGCFYRLSQNRVGRNF